MATLRSSLSSTLLVLSFCLSGVLAESGYLKGTGGPDMDSADLKFLDDNHHQLISRNLKKTTDDDNDDSTWVPLKHDNPDFPSDIVCKKGTNQCKRLCANGRHNKLFLSYVPRQGAGLNDRMGIIGWAAELAAYLCATAHVPTPYKFLGTMHNSGRHVSNQLTWADFVNITLHDGTQVVYELARDESKKMSKKGPFFEGVDSDGNEGIWDVEQSSGEADDFHKIIAKSASPENAAEHFVFQIWGEVHHFGPAVVQSFSKLPVNALGLPRAVAGKNSKSTRSYTEFSKPAWLNDAVDDLWETIISEYPGYRYGSWHIRRGDATRQCDTSLQRMESFMECTFSEVADVKLLVMVATDERSSLYLGGIQKIFDKLPNAEVVFVDAKIRDYMTKLPQKFNNNFHVFEISKGLISKADAFHMEHRRHKICEDCYDMLQQLSQWT